MVAKVRFWSRPKNAMKKFGQNNTGVGLDNPSMTCYQNAILQSLYSKFSSITTYHPKGVYEINRRKNE